MSPCKAFGHVKGRNKRNGSCVICNSLYMSIYMSMLYWGHRIIFGSIYAGKNPRVVRRQSRNRYAKRRELGMSSAEAGYGTVESNRKKVFRYSLHQRIDSKKTKIKELESWLSAQK